MSLECPFGGLSRLGGHAILEVLGRGGMGAVYRARHEALGREVALKVLTGDVEDDETLLVRFKREAEVASKLAHPGLVRVYDFGEDEDLWYIAMELVRGPTLQEVIHAGKNLSLAEVHRMMRELLEAVGALHGAGVLHRDLKPGNVMLEGGQRIRVLDLGLARTQAATLLTGPGFRVGSPRYMAPELIIDGTGSVRTDLWQIGHIGYELITGQYAMPDTASHRLLEQIVQTDMPELPVLEGRDGERLRAVVNRMLKHSAADRFASCAEALAALEWSAGPRRRRTGRAAVGDASAGTSGGASASASPRRRLLAAGAGLLLAVGAAWTAAAWRAGRQVTVEPRAAVSAAATMAASALTTAPLTTAPLTTAPLTTAPLTVAPLTVAHAGGSPFAGAPVGGAPVAGPPPTGPRGRRAAEIEGLLHPPRLLPEFRPPPGGMPDLVRRVLDGCGDAVRKPIFEALRKEFPGDRAAARAVGAEWQRRVPALLGRPAADAVFAELAAARDRLRPADVPEEVWSQYLRRMYELADFSDVVAQQFGVQTGLDPAALLGGALAMSAQAPAGGRAVAAIAFGDQGRAEKRPARTLPPGTKTADGTAQFALALRGMLTGRVELRESWAAGFAFPAEAPERAWLHYRIAGGTLGERLEVRVLGGVRRQVELAFLRAARPGEWWIPVDPRVVRAPASLRIDHENRSMSYVPAGITLDFVELVVAP